MVVLINVTGLEPVYTIHTCIVLHIYTCIQVYTMCLVML